MCPPPSDTKKLLCYKVAANQQTSTKSSDDFFECTQEVESSVHHIHTHMQGSNPRPRGMAWHWPRPARKIKKRVVKFRFSRKRYTIEETQGLWTQQEVPALHGRADWETRRSLHKG